MKKLGITPRLTLIFVLFAGAVLISLGITAYNNGRASLEAATISELLSTALEKQASLNSWVADRQHSISDIANQPQLRETVTAYIAAVPGSSDAMRLHNDLVASLGNWSGEHHRFLSMEVTDASSGRVMIATDADEEGKFREDKTYFINGLQSAYVQNPYYDLVRQSPGMTAAAPILASGGRVIAVLAGRLNMDEMNEIIQRRSGLHQTDEAFLVNTSSLFVTQPRLNADPAVLQLGIHTAAVNLCLSHKSGVVAALDYRDVPAFIVYRWLPERQLCLIAKLDQAEAIAPSRALASTMALAGGLIFLIGSVVAFGMSRTITRPVLQLVQGVERISQGNLDSRIEIKSGDEIGKLGIAFNEMAGAIGEKEAQLRQAAAELEQRVKDRTAELRAGEERYRILSETSPDMIFVIDRQDKVQYVNSLAAKQFRKTPDEVIGKARTELFPPAIAEGQGPGLKQVLKTGEALSSESSVDFPGGQLWLDTQLVALRNEAGEVSAVMGVSRDITERKQAEEALFASEEKYHNLFANAQIGMFRSRLDGSAILDLNQRLADIFGYSIEEMLAEPATIRWAYLDARKEMVRQLGLAGQLVGYEIDIITRNGGIRTCLVSMKLYLQEGILEGSVVDITERKHAEEEIAILARFPAETPNPILRVEQSGRIMYANSASEPLLMDWNCKVDDSLPAYWQHIITDAFTRKNRVIVDAQFGERVYSMMVVPIPDNEYINIYGRDVTERVRAEAALHETNEYLDNLFNCANAPIIVWDPQFKITRYNHAFEALTGRNEHEVLGKSLEILFPPEQIETSMELIQKTLTGERWEVVEIHILHVDGSIRTVLWNSATLFSADGKTPVATIAQGQDISERKHAEYALHKNEEKYRLIAENANDWIYWVAPNRELRFISPSCERLTGYSAKEFIDTPNLLLKVVHPDDRAKVENHFSEAPEKIIPHSIEFRILTKTGDELWINHSCSPVYTQEGQFAGRRGTNRDITERKHTEEALDRRTQELTRSNAELERFAYVASHDLQEPLRMVTSYLQLLERRYKDKLDGDALEFINYAVDGSNRMKTLISDLLAYSRISTRGGEFAITDCEETLERVLSTLQISIEEIKGKVTHDPLPKVMADQAQLESLFQNLIGNAIKFHSKKAPRIHVGVTKDEMNWVFSVSDNGIGIDPQYFERIFIIFQRLHNREDYPGTGIGLAISKRIVERHGGRIWIESNPGEGSTFFFTLTRRGDLQ